MPERSLINKILLAAPKRSSRLWRNNCGVAEFSSGAKVKYGIANPGGSDLIGYSVVRITQDMIGMEVPIFTAIEAKTGMLKLTGDQERFLKAVARDGGMAMLAREVLPYPGYHVTFPIECEASAFWLARARKQ